MNFSFWDIVVVGMTIWGDIIISLTLFSASLILFGTLISGATQRKPPRWTQQWEAFLIGIVVSGVGYAAKFNADAMPIGALFKFSRLTAGLMIFFSIAFVVTAFRWQRSKRPEAIPPPED